MNLTLYVVQMLKLAGLVPDSHQINAVEAVDGIISAVSVEKQVHTIVLFGDANELLPYLALAQDIPKVVMTTTESRTDFKTIGGFNRYSFFVAVGPLQHMDTLWQIQEGFAGAQGFAKGVFVVPTHAYERNGLDRSLYRHFKWCWSAGFSNSLILLETVNGTTPFDVFSYEPLPKVRVQQEVWRSDGNYFYDKLRDFHGYHIRSQVYNDPPIVFRWHAKKTEKPSFKGVAAELFLNFAKQHNAELVAKNVNGVISNSSLEVMHQNTGKFDLLINAYIPYDSVRVSYPIYMEPWCVMVPASSEIATYEYFLRPFKRYIWHICIWNVLHLTLLRSLIVHLLRPKNTRPDFSKAFIEILRHLLYLPTTRFKFGWSVMACFLLANTLGFIFSTLYLAKLASYLLYTIFEPQLDTLDEMVRRNLSINTMDFEIPIIQANGGYLPPGFIELLVPREPSEFFEEILRLPQGHLYASRKHLIDFVLEQQKFMLRPIYHKAKESLLTMPVGFLLPTHSQYESTLKHFILQAAAVGLTEKWSQNAFQYGLQAGIVRWRREIPATLRPLTLHHFTFAWMIIYGGSVLATIFFLLENVERIKRYLKFESINRGIAK